MGRRHVLVTGWPGHRHWWPHVPLPTQAAVLPAASWRQLKGLGSRAALLLGQVTSFGSFTLGAEFAPSHQEPGTLQPRGRAPAFCGAWDPGDAGRTQRCHLPSPAPGKELALLLETEDGEMRETPRSQVSKFARECRKRHF